ncbi:hypothetical protein DRQ23_08560 [bacterium]|nr:MAG: hypothetical protein DRQ23_08560 [bacterium]
MIILLVSMYSNFNLFCIEGKPSTLTIENIHGLDVDMGDNFGGIMENKLFRMAVEFGVTEGICLLKNICLSPVGGVDPGSEIIAPVLYISADIILGSIIPPVVSFKMKRKRSSSCFIKAIGGTLLGEAIGILLFWNSESPLYNLGSRKSWSHLPATLFSVIAINL